MASLNILEALDNLNVLVDVDSIDQIEVTEDAQLIAHLEDAPDDYWVKAGSDEMTREAIVETFKSVHDYLVHFYEKARQNQSDTRHLMEGINSVMVLVGEAANRLEKEGGVFKKRIVEIPEYQQLQDFYKNKVIQELFAEFARAPIVKPVAEEEVEEVAGVHILNDIDVIKRDHLYELFSLKNEAGHDFYTIELARNLKLACDFGQFQERYVSDDPFVQVKNWEDRNLHLFAKRILNSSKKELKAFYKQAQSFKEVDVVKLVHKAVVALHLAANPRNLLRQFSPKSCYLYFHDFQFFMREVIQTAEYKRIEVYSSDQPFFGDLMALVGSLINSFFLDGLESEEAATAVQGMIGKTKGSLLDRLHAGWTALEKAFAQHPYGPVFKALDAVRDRGERLFDPLFQGNIPEVEAHLSNGVEIVRLPAPIKQRFINQAAIASEFKVYLRTTKESHLLINYQDRTSWREHARVVALEELGKQAEFSDRLTVVSLAKDTEFYNQSGIYKELNDAKDFIEQFAYHLGDGQTGYSFPPKIHDELLPTWTASMLELVHKTFFANKPKLEWQERIDFISISYLLMELKILELVEPTVLSHISKDGLDVSNTSTAALWVFLKEQQAWEEWEVEKLFTLLFVPTMLHRERTPHPERMERLESIIKTLEKGGAYLKTLEKLFKPKSLNISFLDN